MKAAKQPRRAPQAETQHFGQRIQCWQAQPARMPQSHRHNDIEINYVERGVMHYLFGNGALSVWPDQWAVFWAARPHRLVDVAADTLVNWVVLPLPTFLTWDMPARFVKQLLDGQVLVDTAADRDAHADKHVLNRWRKDVPARHSKMAPSSLDASDMRDRIVELELQARLLRMSLQNGAGTVARRPHATALGKAEQMAHYLTRHFAEDIRVEHVARQVNVHPNHAMHLFRKVYDMSLIDYLTEQRIAHAQQLLATTSHSVIDIALACGFGSLSRFYIAFKRLCGTTPKAYRAGLTR